MIENCFKKNKFVVAFIRDLVLRLDIWLHGDKPCGRMLVVDQDNLLKQILILLKKESFDMVVDVMILEHLFTFSGEQMV